jgi:hypothetical protein
MRKRRKEKEEKWDRGKLEFIRWTAEEARLLSD